MAIEETPQIQPLSVSQLRWTCPETSADFDSTRDVAPIAGVVGQDDAVDALRFGLEFDGPGQNIYVRGLTGTGRAHVGAAAPARHSADL